MIKIDMLKTFATVARCGSLNQAAAKLSRTPSAISMTLKRLEDHLGEPLFEPGRKSSLTPLGRFVLDMAERELAHFERSTRLIEDVARARGGEVYIAAVPSFARLDLSEVIARFLTEHPGVRFEVRDIDSDAITRQVLQGRIDLGIVSDAKEDEELRRFSLGSDVFGLIVHEDDPLAGQPKAAWTEIEGLRLIDNPLCDRFDMPGVRRTLASAELRVQNTTTLVSMIRAGLGCTVLPERVVRGASNGIVFVPLCVPEFRRELHLVHRSRDTLNPAAAALRNALIGRAGGTPAPR